MEPTITLSAWIEGCLQNHRGSQQKMYSFLHDFAARICYRYTQDAEETQDLVNESFLKFFKGLERFQTGDPDNLEAMLKGWFKRIIINTCIDHFRKNQHQFQKQELQESTQQVEDQSENGLDVLSYKEILQGIKQLSSGYRTVFNLFVIEGMTHEEISATLGISVGTSKSNLSKARENLRQYLLKKQSFSIYA